MTNGFVKGPSVTEDILVQLQEEFGKRNNRYSSGTQAFQSTNMFPYSFEQQEDYQVIINALAPYLEKNFFNAKVILPNFLLKRADVKVGDLHLHQDWSYVDEEKFCSLNIWIPLVDVGTNNGTIHFVKSTHLADKRVRGRNIWWAYYDIREHIVAQSCVPVNLKAGESVIHFNSILHYTSTNLSSSNRPAISLVITMKEADAMVYFGKEEKIYRARVPDNFYMKHGVFCSDFEQGLNAEFQALESDYKMQGIEPLKPFFNYGT